MTILNIIKKRIAQQSILLLLIGLIIYFLVKNSSLPDRSYTLGNSEDQNSEVYNGSIDPNDSEVFVVSEIHERSSEVETLLRSWAEEILRLKNGSAKIREWKELLRQWFEYDELSLLKYLESISDDSLAAHSLTTVLQDWIKNDPSVALEYAKLAIETSSESHEWYLGPYLDAIFDSHGIYHVCDYLAGFEQNEHLYGHFVPIYVDYIQANPDEAMRVLESVPFEPIKPSLAEMSGVTNSQLRGWEWFDDLLAQSSSDNKYFTSLLSGTLNALYFRDEEGVLDLLAIQPVDPAFDAIRVKIASEKMQFNPKVALENAKYVSDVEEKNLLMIPALIQWFDVDFEEASEWALNNNISDDIILKALQLSEVPTSQYFEEKINEAVLIKDPKERKRTISLSFLPWSKHYPEKAEEWLKSNEYYDYFEDFNWLLNEIQR